MTEHCCESMRTRLDWSCDRHEDLYDCPDTVVVFLPNFQEYGLPIHDGGRSMIGIAHCPWCGTRLPEPQRDRWFDELERQGYDDPSTQHIPERYRDGSWLRDSRGAG